MTMVAVTMGDPAGIGPEVSLKAALHVVSAEETSVVLIGSAPLLKQQAEESCLLWNDDWVVSELKQTDTVGLQILSPHHVDFSDFNRGEVSVKGGEASILYLRTALQLIRLGSINALATAPINKRSWELIESSEMGHTEFLAKEFDVSSYLMTFFSHPLKVAVLTRHIPLSEVSKNIDKEKILNSLHLIKKYLRLYLSMDHPKIAVCGLNPHAGEMGRIGNEEVDVIIPAISQAQEDGIDVEGPFSADILFTEKYLKKYDFFLTMYHDQGLIPFKTLSFEEGVNVTLGLPFIRTSVDHGTAYDIVGTRTASERSMIAAIRWAVRFQN